MTEWKAMRLYLGDKVGVCAEEAERITVSASRRRADEFLWCSERFLALADAVQDALAGCALDHASGPGGPDRFLWGEDFVFMIAVPCGRPDEADSPGSDPDGPDRDTDTP